MTNNELKDQICEVIKALCDEEAKEAQDFSKKEATCKNYHWADIYDRVAFDYMHIGAMAIIRIENFFDEIEDEVESGDSPYKEMWEELKKHIEGRESGYEKSEKKNGADGYYNLASECRVRKNENISILHKMKNIEAERGIEQ